MKHNIHWSTGLGILTLLLTLMVAGVGQISNPSVPVKAQEPEVQVVEVVKEKELNQDDWLDVAIYIAREFKPYGKKVVIESLVISYLEGKWDRTSTNTYNSNGQIDRGYWQIGDKPHPKASDECARDLVCSTNYAKKLYDRQGWKPWVASWVLLYFW